MIAVNEPERILPVDLPTTLIRALPSGRVRAALLPIGRYGDLRVGDCLWLRARISVPDVQRSGLLAFRYAGEAQLRMVRWPEGEVRPCAGIGTLASMPLRLSRYSLVVEACCGTCVDDLTEDEAVEIGATPLLEGGWCSPLLDPDSCIPLSGASEAVLDLLVHGAERGACVRTFDRRAELLFVRFRAIARNIADLFPDRGLP